MENRSIWKWALFAALTVFSLAVVFSKGITLGLDLKGGVSFVVQIETNALREQIRVKLRENHPAWDAEKVEESLAAEISDAVAASQKRAREIIGNRIDGLGIREAQVFTEGVNRISIQVAGVQTNQWREIQDVIKQVGALYFRLVHEDNSELVDALFKDGEAPPGYAVARLTDDRGNEDIYYVRTGKDLQPVEELRRFRAPPKCDFMLERRDVGSREAYRPCFVYKAWELTGEHVVKAVDRRGSMGEALVHIELDALGKRIFRRVTEDYVAHGKKNQTAEGRQLAIVLDNTLCSAPVLRAVIDDGKAVIEGMRSVDEARRLANVLQAGSLPAPVEIIEKHGVDASLGADSIRSGVRAVLVGGVAVVLLMAFFYYLSGMIANLALVLDLLLLPAGMVLAAGFMGIFIGNEGARSVINLPVLTLPGLAGIALTLGMAVDANVLIFERMREELRLGKTVKAAVAAGYDRALSAIADSNITTMFAGIILFVIGSGTIRGFAVTLVAGIVVSMFTAVVVTRMVYDLWLSKSTATTLRMRSLIGRTNIDFISKQHIAIAISLVVIAGSWFMMGRNLMRDRTKVYGVDFTGGSAVTFMVQDEKTKPTVSEIRDLLAAAGIGDAQLQYKRPIEGGGSGELLVRTGAEKVGGVEAVQVISETILTAYSKSGLSQGKVESIGSQVGGELLGRSVKAIAVSLLIMIVYISWRFEFAFAVGAIVALLHDVLVTAGVYCLFGRQMSLTVVAALLTIVGYSVNDTIVIFDRIRENLRNTEYKRTKTYREIANLSVNETLSRTLLTNLTAFTAVVALLLVGGGAINDFALAMFIGMIAGTYSTVYIATPVMLLWHRERPAAAKGA